MPIVLPHPLSTPEMRILQEFRRLGVAALPLSAIDAIRHPLPAEGATESLISKGYLARGESDNMFILTEKGKELVSRDIKPGDDRGPSDIAPRA